MDICNRVYKIGSISEPIKGSSDPFCPYEQLSKSEKVKIEQLIQNKPEPKPKKYTYGPWVDAE